MPALLLVFLISGFVSARGDSATSDETPHIGAGVSYLDKVDFRMNPEHPPLAKLWAALPVWALDRGRPDYSGRWWEGTERTADGRATGADQWVFGFELLNGPLESPVRADPGRVLLPARSMMLLLGVALGLVVWTWSKQMWGNAGALVSLFLFSLSPTMLAHARLVTTDIAAALGFTAAAWLFRRALTRPDIWRVAAAGCALGAALLFKFSAVLLGPILVMIALVWVLIGDEGDRSHRVHTVLRVLPAVAILAWAGIWAGYGFRWEATASGYVLPWEMREAVPGGLSPIILWARDHRLFPEAWLFGLGAALQDEIRLAYFHGQVSELGFRSYFPMAFLLKTAPALLLLSTWAVLGGLRSWRTRKLDAIVLSVVFLVYAGVAVSSRLNLGHRHLAPLEPVLFVACGAIPLLANVRWKRVVAGTLLAGYAISWAAATPGYLSYFNLFAGGTRGGARWLLDSNLDWGQDLQRLAAWMRTQELEEIHLAYFGTADPKAYGIRYKKVFFFADFRSDVPNVRPEPGDLVAVSANLLHGLYLNPDRELARELVARGTVPVSAVREFVEERDAKIRAREPYERLAEWMVSHGYADAEEIRRARAPLLQTWMERLRTEGERVDTVGGSIWIYRVPPLASQSRPWPAADP